MNSLTEEITLLKKELSNQGFFNFKTDSLLKITKNSYLLNFNTKQCYKHITINYKNNILKKELSAVLTKNTTLTENSFFCPTKNLQENLNNILTYLSRSGKTFSSLQLTNIRIYKNEVIADLQIKETKQNRISKVTIKGYEKFPKKFVHQYLNLKVNQVLNLDEIQKKSALLNQLPFANELKQPEVLFTKETNTVFLYIDKKKNNLFDGYIGFSTNPETQKLELNGNINLRLLNNLNSGEEFNFKYLSTADEQKRIQLNINLPYLLNTSFGIEGGLNIFKKDSSFTNSTQNIKLNYAIQQLTNISIGTRFTKSTTTNDTSVANQDFSKNEYSTFFNHQKNQNHSFFREKNKTTLEIALAERRTSNKNTPQQIIRFYSAHIFNINKTNSIYIKNQSFYLISDTVLENEMEFIGGINSIRGFQENSIPSNLYSYLNTEYRIQLSNKLYMHSVIDYGFTKNNNKSNTLFSFGFGGGLKSKNNLIRFIIANSRTNNEKTKLSNSQIHLSLISSF